MPTQSLDMAIVIIALVLEAAGILLLICLSIGIYRTFKRDILQPLQYSSMFQIFNVYGICFAIMASQIELLYYNWNALYFDQRDLAITKTVWLQYLIVTFYALSYAPIYISGFLQIIALKYILEDVDGYIRRAIIDTPIIVYSLGLIPGIIFSIIYWIEVYIRGLQIYTVMGYFIGPNIFSVTFITMVAFAMTLTLFGCFLSYLSFQKLKRNREKMLAAAKKSNVPNFVVFQVLGIGLTLPFIGFLKGVELLIWYYPSPANIYISCIGMLVLLITPYNTFYLNGTHKNVYPLVPLVSWILKLNYESVIKKESVPKVHNPDPSDRKTSDTKLV